MNILTELAQKNLISQEEVEEISSQLQETDDPVEKLLKAKGVAPRTVAEIRSQELNIPLAEVNPDTLERELLEYIPEESATYYKMVPLELNDGVLKVGTVDPSQIELRDALNFIASKHGLTYTLAIIPYDIFEEVIERYKDLVGEVKEALSELDKEFEINQRDMGQEGEGDDDIPDVEEKLAESEQKAKKAGGSRIIEEAPVTKIVATILRYATDGNASDVHVEPLEKNVRVRFRVDGTLNTSLVLPKKAAAPVTARIKILSNMKLDEKRKPQDGRFSAKIEGRKIDFRVSTFPTYYGEKVVMRILDQERGVKPIDQIGLRAENVTLLREGVDKPHGIILISGPTGSGKTTTLYSLLQEVDRLSNNVLSLEDPVEYNLDGVSQSQVRDDIGYTFATGLRTILRQDPDIIMVGEIRDKETAHLAIQAALTGHLVLSTIHTNSAIGVIPRLVDMGIDPYLIAPTLILAIAQRLASTLCPDAKKEVPVEGSMRTLIEKIHSGMPERYREEVPIPDVVYEAGSSAECPGGIRGRTAIMEALLVDNDMERIILDDPNEFAIEKAAREKGMLTMKEDALLRAFKGDIPFTEVNAFG